MIMIEIREGMKVRVISGDRDIVLHDPFGTVRKLDLTKDTCEIHLASAVFTMKPSRIGAGEKPEVIPYEWTDRRSMDGRGSSPLPAMTAVIFSSRRSPKEAAAKVRQLNKHNPNWRTLRHPNGRPIYDEDGTMLDENGSRSIFDDVDD